MADGRDEWKELALRAVNTAERMSQIVRGSTTAMSVSTWGYGTLNMHYGHNTVYPDPVYRCDYCRRYGHDLQCAGCGAPVRPASMYER